MHKFNETQKKKRNEKYFIHYIHIHAYIFASFSYANNYKNRFMQMPFNTFTHTILLRTNAYMYVRSSNSLIISAADRKGTDDIIKRKELKTKNIVNVFLNEVKINSE